MFRESRNSIRTPSLTRWGTCNHNDDDNDDNDDHDHDDDDDDDHVDDDDDVEKVDLWEKVNDGVLGG